jgi:hypothetical protein
VFFSALSSRENTGFDKEELPWKSQQPFGSLQPTKLPSMKLGLSFPFFRAGKNLLMKQTEIL